MLSVIAHEIGHLMGLIWGGQGNSPDTKDIMGAIGGKVSEKDINYILQLNRGFEKMAAGLPAPNMFAGGRVWFGVNANGATMFNSGNGWQPIGSASADIRWLPGVTGNW